MLRLILTLLCLTLVACNPPSRRSQRVNEDAFTGNNNLNNQNNSNNQGNQNNNFPNNNTGNTNTDNNNTSNNNSSNQSQVPSYLSHCSFDSDGSANLGRNDFMYRSNDLGNFTLCQSRQNSREAYLQVESFSNNSAQLCLMPLTGSSSGFTYIGEPRCLSPRDNMQVYKIDFRVNRNGYSNSAVTGAILLRDSTLNFPSPYNRYMLNLDAFVTCMNYLGTYGSDIYCRTYDQVGQFTIVYF